MLLLETDYANIEHCLLGHFEWQQAPLGGDGNNPPEPRIIDPVKVSHGAITISSGEFCPASLDPAFDPASSCDESRSCGLGERERARECL